MKKASALVRIILLSVVAIALIGVLTAALIYRNISTSASAFDWSSATLTERSRTDPKKIDSLRIDWVNGNILLETADIDQIIVSEAAGKDAPKTTVSVSGRTLTVDYGESRKWFSFFSGTEKNLMITVPRDWDFQGLEINSASADAVICGAAIRKVSIHSASGSSDFDLCDVDTLELASTSGYLEYTGTLNQLGAAGISSDVILNLTNHPSEIAMSSTSGNLTVHLPADCGFTAECGSVSGKFSTNFDVTSSGKQHTFGDGSCRITLDGISADLIIGMGE